MEPGPSRLADADSDLADAVFVALGVPHDATASYRKGAREGPAAIRHASYNFETWLLELGVDMEEIPVHDAGDTPMELSSGEMVDFVDQHLSRLLGGSRIPVVMGGEHNATEGAVRALSRRHNDLRVLVLDAHMDLRSEYMGDSRSHACATRRCADVVGVDRIAVLGIRSTSLQELEAAREEGMAYASADRVREEGLDPVMKDLMTSIGDGHLYLSIDLDVLDPSHAPGVQNPEPWGLSVLDVRHIIDGVASRLVGFDIMECAPAYDGGQTATVGARLLRHTIGAIWLLRGENPFLSGI
jgi:agmatinase